MADASKRPVYGLRWLCRCGQRAYTVTLIMGFMVRV